MPDVPRPQGTRPPHEIELIGDAHYSAPDIKASIGETGFLILKQGPVRIDLVPAASLKLLRWLMWHGLHGLWAPPRYGQRHDT